MNPQTFLQPSSPTLPKRLMLVGTTAGPMTATEAVRQSLRRAILNGDIPGGTPLGLSEVAAALGVSTTPVREALRILASQGFITLDPYRGGVVRTLDRQEIVEVVKIRHLLEPTAVEEAIAGLTEVLLGRAEAVLNRLLENPLSENWVEWNREFHDTLYEGASSRRLVETIRHLQDPVLMYVNAAIRRHHNFRQEANRQHRLLFDAMRAGDVTTSVEITLAHVALPIRATESPRESVSTDPIDS